MSQRINLLQIGNLVIYFLGINLFYIVYHDANDINNWKNKNDNKTIFGQNFII